MRKEVWFLSFVMLINRSGMMVLPFLTLFLTKELGWSKFHTGIATSCFGLGSIAGSFIGGWLTDRIGTQKVMKLSLLLGGISFFFFLWIHDFLPLCILIFMTTTLGDAFRPALFTSVQEFSEDQNLTRGISLVRLAVNLGISIGPAIGGFLAAYYGYNWLFIIDGSTCILAAVILMAFFHPVSEQKTTSEPSIELRPSVSPYRDKIFVFFLVSNLLMLVGFFQILYSIPVFFGEVYSLDESLIGWFFTANGLLIFLFEMPVIYLMERKYNPLKSMIYGVLMMSIGFLSLVLFQSIIVAIICFTLLVSFGEIINFPFISTVALRRAGENKKGKYMGATTVLFSLAFFLAPLSGLPVIQMIGYDLYWFLVALVMGLAILGYRYVMPKIL